MPENNQKQEQQTVVSYAPEYAGFYDRFLASILDNILLIIAMGLLGKIILNNKFLPDDIINSIGAFGWWIGWGSFSITTGIFGIIFMILLGLEVEGFDDSFYIATLTFILFTNILKWFYLTRLESLPRKATIGKKIMGIIVTDLNGNLISFARANARYLAKTISLITLLIGFIMAAFTKKKQGLHDKIAGTLVVKKKP
nr:RDD family protein [Okeania sp. SIO3I5]